MPVELIYSASMAFALFGWVALVLAPINRSYCIAFARGVALVLAITYAAQLMFNMQSVEGGSFWSISGIALLFSAPENAMLGWTHYLAFDLFIGSWEVEDAAAKGIPHWFVILCLGLTLMIGPIGLLVYFIGRSLMSSRAAPEPAKV